METKKAIQLLGQKMGDLYTKELANDYLFLKLNRTKEVTEKMVKKYKLK